MSQTIVNLTLPIVAEKIDQLLNTYPRQPHQKVFNSPEWRHKLTAYVLSRLPVVYVAMENHQAAAMNVPVECYSHEQHAQIEQIIHQGIDSLITHRRHTGYRYRASASTPSAVPSNWFG